MATSVQISRRGQPVLRGCAGLVGSPWDGGLITGPVVASETFEPPAARAGSSAAGAPGSPPRSEEPRVGEEWRSRGSPYHSKKKRGLLSVTELQRPQYKACTF